MRKHVSLVHLLVISFGIAVTVFGFSAVRIVSAQESSRDVEIELDRQILEKEKVIEELKMIINQIRLYEQEKKILRTKLETVDTLKENQLKPVRLLDELNRRLPEKIWLVELRTVKTLIAIRGYSLSKTAIGEFMAALERSPYFHSVVLKKTSLRRVADRETYYFEMDFNF